MEPDPDSPGLWNIRLRTQHGTYVKEAISGEGGKTSPSLASLLEVQCRCESLDVLAILDEGGAEELAEPRQPDTFGAGILE